jgi:hypothetical protein
MAKDIEQALEEAEKKEKVEQAVNSRYKKLIARKINLQRRKRVKLPSSLR